MRLPLEGGYKVVITGRIASLNGGCPDGTTTENWLRLLSVLEAQASTARQANAWVPDLVDLGVIDGERVRALLDDVFSGRRHHGRLGWAGECLNLEAWARAHA